MKSHTVVRSVQCLSATRTIRYRISIVFRSMFAHLAYKIKRCLVEWAERACYVISRDVEPIGAPRDSV